MKKRAANLVALWLVILLLVALSAGPALALVDDNSVSSNSIVDLTIKAVDIAKGAIKTAKLANKAVTTLKLADNAVTSAKIANGTITDADIAGGAAIAASKINTAGANITAANFTYASPKTGYLTLLGAAFGPEASGDTFDKYWYYVYATNNGADRWFIAPFALPNGATITNISYVVWDNDAVIDSRAMIRRHANDFSNDTMALADSAGASASWQTAPGGAIGNPVVDNANYSYTAEVKLDGTAGTNIRAGKVIITYTYTTPGD